MKPLAECPGERLRGLRGVLTDIDDTLTAGGGIEPAALAGAAAPAGGEAGCHRDHRAPGGLERTLRDGMAGSGDRGGERCRDAAQARGRAGARLRRAGRSRQANCLRLRACAADVLARVPGATLAEDSPGRLTDIAIDHSEFAHLDAAQIEAVCAVMREHGLRATVSSIHVNGWIGDHSKWTGARWAVETALNVPFWPQEWLYVGDSTNDETMFERMPLSVGVANIARFAPTMRHLPAYVTTAERGAGFAELAERLLAAQE